MLLTCIIPQHTFEYLNPIQAKLNYLLGNKLIIVDNFRTLRE